MSEKDKERLVEVARQVEVKAASGDVIAQAAMVLIKEMEQAADEEKKRQRIQRQGW